MSIQSFKNKTVVITGAASGMGRAYALAFARLGARLAICDVNEAGLAETRQQVLPLLGVDARASAARLLVQTLDVSDRVAMQAFAARVEQTLGHAHVIINNAGIGGGGQPAWAMSAEQYERTLQVNFLGVVYGTQAFLPQLLANKEGAIVNVSSVFGLVGVPNTSDYCAAKFAVRGFSESLMIELADSPITVHLVHPGGIRTNIASGVEGGDEFTRRFLKTDPDEFVQYVIRGIQNGKQRIVYGHQSRPLWWMSWALPLRWRNRLLRRQMDAMLDPAVYDRVKVGPGRTKS